MVQIEKGGGLFLGDGWWGGIAGGGAWARMVGGVLDRGGGSKSGGRGGVVLDLCVEVVFDLGEAVVKGAVFVNESCNRVGDFLERVGDLGADGPVDFAVHLGVEFVFEHFGNFCSKVVRVDILGWLGDD